MAHGLPGYPGRTRTDDQVPRLRGFRARHQDIDITPPNAASGGFWKATRAGEPLACEIELADLLDALEEQPATATTDDLGSDAA